MGLEIRLDCQKLTFQSESPRGTVMLQAMAAPYVVIRTLLLSYSWDPPDSAGTLLHFPCPAPSTKAPLEGQLPFSSA